MKPEYSQNGRQAPSEWPLDWARNLWHTRFLGVRTLQFYVDLLLYERILNQNACKFIVELGSASGGLTLYLALQAYQRDCSFATFDMHPPDALTTPVGKLLALERCFHQGDMWSATFNDILTILRDAPRPLLLICDGGNKPREFKAFVPHLHSDDIVAVHDWGNEFSESDVTPETAPLVEPYFVDECNDMGSLTRLWRLK